MDESVLADLQQRLEREFAADPDKPAAAWIVGPHFVATIYEYIRQVFENLDNQEIGAILNKVVEILAELKGRDLTRIVAKILELAKLVYDAQKS